MNKTIINTNVPEFSVPAFVNGEFKTITKEDTLGHWSIFFSFIPQISHLYAQPSCLIWQTIMLSSPNLAPRFTL